MKTQITKIKIKYFSFCFSKFRQITTDQSINSVTIYYTIILFLKIPKVPLHSNQISRRTLGMKRSTVYMTANWTTGVRRVVHNPFISHNRHIWLREARC